MSSAHTPEGSVEDVIDAVHKMKEALWVNGGLIGQFEAGPDMPLENIKSRFNPLERLKILSKHGTVSAECKQHSRCPL